jgi:hypothetical protein
VAESTFGLDFHQQFGTHLVEESKTAWQGHVQQAEATTAQAPTPPPVPKAANPSALAAQPSAGTGTDASASEVKHTTSGVFEVSLERLRASA